jgi:hypothetical protein
MYIPEEGLQYDTMKLPLLSSHSGATKQTTLAQAREEQNRVITEDSRPDIINLNLKASNPAYVIWAKYFTDCNANSQEVVMTQLVRGSPLKLKETNSSIFLWLKTVVWC